MSNTRTTNSLTLAGSALIEAARDHVNSKGLYCIVYESGEVYGTESAIDAVESFASGYYACGEFLSFDFDRRDVSFDDDVVRLLDADCQCAMCVSDPL